MLGLKCQTRSVNPKAENYGQSRTNEDEVMLLFKLIDVCLHQRSQKKLTKPKPDI